MSRKAHYRLFNFISAVLVIAIIAGMTVLICKSWVQEFDSWTMEERIKY